MKHAYSHIRGYTTAESRDARTNVSFCCYLYHYIYIYTGTRIYYSKQELDYSHRVIGRRRHRHPRVPRLCLDRRGRPARAACTARRITVITSGSCGYRTPAYAYPSTRPSYACAVTSHRPPRRRPPPATWKVVWVPRGKWCGCHVESGVCDAPAARRVPRGHTCSDACLRPSALSAISSMRLA